MLSNDRLNRIYMVLLYAVLGIGGSAFSVLVIGAAIFSSVKLLARRLHFPRQPEIWSLTIAGLAYYGSGMLMIATNPFDAGNYPFSVERILFLGFLPLFLQIALLDRDRLIEVLEIGAAIGAAGLATWAVWEWWLYKGGFSDFRVSGAPGNPGPYATACGVLLAVCIIGSLRNVGTLKGRFLYLGMVLSAFSLMMSGMRTLYPLLLLLPLICIFLFRGRSKTRNIRFTPTFAVLAIVVISLGGLVAFSRLGLLLSMLNESGLNASAANSLGQRIALLTCARDGFLSAPLLGMGRDGAYAFMSQCTEVLVGQPLQFSHFHNAAATALMIGGLPELMATSALLLVPLYWCWRHRRDPERRYGVVLILSILVVYGLNGTSNLMLGHDIHDALFVHLMAVALVLLVGDTATAQRRQAAQRQQG